MTDNPRANETPVTTNPEAPMPSVEQTTATPTEAPEAAAPEREVSAGTEEGTAKSENFDDLPEGTSDRTREQFDKLRSQLREEKAKRVQTQSVFEQLKPFQQPSAPVSTSQFIDPVTGNVDVNGLNYVISTTQQRAERAEQTVQRWVEEQQTKEAYTSYPELNPSHDSFNASLHRKTRAVLMDSMINPQDYSGKPLSFKEAADIAKGVTPEVLQKAQEEGAKKAIEGLTPKEQASLEASGRSDRRNQTSNLDDLKWRTRKGDPSAITERLRNIPPTTG